MLSIVQGIPSPFEQKTNDCIMFTLGYFLCTLKNETYFHLISPFTFLLANRNHQHFHHFHQRLCHCCERSHAVIPKPSSCASASIITSLKIITAWLKSKLLSRSMVQGEWIWRIAIFGDCHTWESFPFQQIQHLDFCFYGFGYSSKTTYTLLFPIDSMLYICFFLEMLLSLSQFCRCSLSSCFAVSYSGLARTTPTPILLRPFTTVIL